VDAIAARRHFPASFWYTDSQAKRVRSALSALHDVVPRLKRHVIEVLLKAGLALCRTANRDSTAGDAEETIGPLGYQPVRATLQVRGALSLMQAEQFGPIG
jgi:hypothetical protein